MPKKIFHFPFIKIQNIIISIMYEIELKAHVTDRERTVAAVNSFASFKGTVKKDDTYFQFERKPDSNLGADGTEKPVTCRIRRETAETSDGTKRTTYILTYKKKERILKNGIPFECNEEHETILSDAKTVETLLEDTGFSVAYTKQETAAQWETNTQFGNALLELCTVEKLGDFLEIEILAASGENAEEIQNELKNLILKSGLNLSDIEEKYYSDMLKEVEEDAGN